ncbi:Adenosine monophosphate-protein transferase SoFic [Sedimentisphaera cyanobacteriorum]|uniref:Adenosine monophosphate-protein transferase SoFic n=2 Tax=Sedimentisphaera cyanobacteriorum TaxID=1940790 RepID=A0A1Q2HT26_9BACT|nr:Adenosine monophosphate-protein transferase SoFic [Sedimentisphaera cyanobacteriorum]
MELKKYKAGCYVNQGSHKSFSPQQINHSWIWSDAKINILLEKANKCLGELNAFSRFIPDIDLYIGMHIFKEAQSSSKIEGTKTEIDEVLMDKSFIAPEKREDWQEVQNYVKAMNHGIEKLGRMPLSSRLLREMHSILLDSVRGKHKSPGEYRKSQNWIGGSSIDEAIYVPPCHSEIGNLMNDMEKFIHNDKALVPHLIKIAIIHYQFETIHPFLDGNGRIGRLLITFYLVGVGLLDKPTLYISDYFERNRQAYYDSLSRVRQDNNISQWIEFFLEAMVKTSEKGVETFGKIQELKNKYEKEIVKFGRRSENAHKLLNRLYSNPVITIQETSEFLSLSVKASSDLIKTMVENNLLIELTGYKRNRIFVLHEYLMCF